MFFDMDLLCRQRQGKFAVIWLAATHGIENISRKEVDHVNILKTCEEIFKYVMSDSKSPRNRLSLYLSANLIHGIVLVYRKQVYNFEQSIVTFICTIKRPICIVDFSLEDGEEKIKKRRLVSKKQRAIQAPDQPNEDTARLSLVQQQEIELKGCEEQLRQSLARQELNTTDCNNITIREEVTGPPNERMELFGDEGQIDYQLAQFPDETSKIIAPVIAQIPDQSLDQTLHPLPTEIPVPEVPALSPNDKITISTTEKRPHSPTEELPTSKRRKLHDQQQELIEDQLIVEVDPANVPLPSDPANPPIPVPVPQPIAPTPKKRSSFIRPRHFLNGSVKNWSRVAEINRTSFKYDEIGSKIHKPESLRVRNVDPAEIMALLLSGLRFSDQDISAVVIGNAKENTTIETSGADLNTVNDLSKRLTLDREQPFMEVSVQELAVPLPVQVNNDEQILEMIPDVKSPRLSCILKPTEEITSIREIRVEHGQGDMTGVYRPRIHASTPLVFDTEYIRQQTMLSRLRTLFEEEEHVQLTMWQIVFPLTRFNVAMAFSDLLHLQAKGYVVLIPATDSNELQYVKPGKKLCK